MATERDLSSVREAVGVFVEAAKLEAATDELLENGFDRADISLLAAQDEIEKNLGHRYSKVTELEDDPDVPRRAFTPLQSVHEAEGALISLPLYVAAVTTAGIVTAAGGPLAAILAATAIAGSGGGFLGLVLAGILGNRYASEIENQINKGGILLWVRTWDKAQEERAQKILTRHGAFDVHVHQLYKAAGGKTSADYESPEQLVADPDLTRDEKISILRNWEYDARELAVATEEGMGQDDAGLLGRILVCLHELRPTSASDKVVPTKQGGTSS